MQQAADTMPMYYATWIGWLQHGRASIHHALLLLLLLLLLLPLPPSYLLSATRSRIFFLSFPYVATGRWPSDCWNADAAFSRLVLKFNKSYYLSYISVRL